MLYSENQLDHVAKCESIRALMSHVKCRDPEYYLTLPSTTWSDTEIAHELGIFTRRPKYILFENRKSPDEFMRAAEKRNSEIFGGKSLFWNFVEYYRDRKDVCADFSVGSLFTGKIGFGFYDFCGQPGNLEHWLTRHLCAYAGGADICFTFWIDHCGRLSAQRVQSRRESAMVSRMIAKRNGVSFPCPQYDDCDSESFGEVDFSDDTLFRIKNGIQSIITRLWSVGLRCDYFNFYREHSDNPLTQVGRSVMASFHTRKELS